jgi:mediator of RNA polymerase II transcription subunit 9
MVFRFLFKYLLNNPQIVEKLADSYVMRRLAQMSVSAFFKAKAIAEEAKNERFKDFDSAKLKSFLDKFHTNFKEEMEKAKTELEEQKKKIK